MQYPRSKHPQSSSIVLEIMARISIILARSSVLVGIVSGVRAAPSADNDGGGERTELSRRQLIEMVLQRNQGIEAQKVERKISQWNLQREWSIFEPELVTSYQRQENERENTGQQQSSLFPFVSQDDSDFTSEDNLFSTSIEGLLPLGTRYSLQSTLQDLENDTNNQNSEYVSFTGINLRQPILQGAGVEITMTGIRIATVQTDISLQELRRRVLSIVATSERTYWDVVAAQKEYKMRSESVAIAQKILIDNRERVKAGKMSDLEVAQAATGLEIRQRQLHDAKQRLLIATNSLRSLIADSATDSTLQVLAIDSPELSQMDFDTYASIDRAFSMNPDFLIKKYELEQEDIRLVFAKNQQKPQLDLIASYGLNGLGENPEESFRDVGASQFEAWTIGVELRMALGGGKRAKSELQTIKLRKKQRLLELKDIEVQIVNTIDTITSRLEMVVDRVASYHKEIRFNERLLDVELARLAEGKSDSRKVLELEEDLFDVKQAELTNLVDYQVALLELRLAEGSLLEKRDIEIVENAL